MLSLVISACCVKPRILSIVGAISASLPFSLSLHKLEKDGTPLFFINCHGASADCNLRLLGQIF